MHKRRIKFCKCYLKHNLYVLCFILLVCAVLINVYFNPWLFSKWYFLTDNIHFSNLKYKYRINPQGLFCGDGRWPTRETVCRRSCEAPGNSQHSPHSPGQLHKYPRRGEDCAQAPQERRHAAAQPAAHTAQAQHHGTQGRYFWTTSWKGEEVDIVLHGRKYCCDALIAMPNWNCNFFVNCGFWIEHVNWTFIVANFED